MSLQDLTQAAAAQNALTARINAFFDQLESDRDDYAGLAADLAAVVSAKLKQTFYVDAVAGNDAGPGTVASPMKTIEAAAAKVLPGGNVKILLMADQEHAASGIFTNNRIIFGKYGNGASPILRTKAGWGTGFQFDNCAVAFGSIDIGTGLIENGVAPNSMFKRAGASRISLLFSPITIGDADFFEHDKEDVGLPALTVYNCPITRVDGSTGTARLMRARLGTLSIGGSTSIPAGSTFADFVPVVRNADGDAVNFLSNIVL